MGEQVNGLDKLAAALVKFQSEVTAIPKSDNNPFFKSKYAGLPAVVATASPILEKHGLAISQHLGFDGENDTLTTWLIHESGQYIKDTMRLHLVKDDPQGQGSATTYARRYSYMAVLGLVADEDDDGNAATQRRQLQPQKPAPQAPKPQGKVTLKQADELQELARKAHVALEKVELSIEKINEGKLTYEVVRDQLVNRLMSNDNTAEYDEGYEPDAHDPIDVEGVR